MGERDVALLQAIEAHVNVKMKAYEAVEEEVVLKSMNKINTARRTGMCVKSENGGIEVEKRKAKCSFKGETFANYSPLSRRL